MRRDSGAIGDVAAAHALRAHPARRAAASALENIRIIGIPG
jgi:hypothetical protein